MPSNFAKQLRKSLGFDYLEEFITKSLATTEERLKEDMSAKFKELMSALEQNGIVALKILDAVNLEAPLILAALNSAKEGGATDAELDEAIAAATKGQQGLAQVQAAISGMVPTIPSPTTPPPIAPPSAPTPTPTPVTTEAPISADDVKITPSSTPGILNIDA